MRMSRKARWRLVLAMAIGAGFPAPAIAEATGKIWYVDAASLAADGQARMQYGLSYGLPETDDMVIRLSCAPGSGMLNVLVPHTLQRMKRGSRSIARLTAGGTRWSIRGKILPNDESRDESFAGRAAFDPAEFLRLATADRLQISVGFGPAQSAPLAGAGEKFTQFSLTCAKP